MLMQDRAGFVTGVAIGLIFGRPAGLWLAGTLDLLPGLSAGEILLSGSAVEQSMLNSSPPIR